VKPSPSGLENLALASSAGRVELARNPAGDPHGRPNTRAITAGISSASGLVMNCEYTGPLHPRQTFSCLRRMQCRLPSPSGRCPCLHLRLALEAHTDRRPRSAGQHRSPREAQLSVYAKANITCRPACHRPLSIAVPWSGSAASAISSCRPDHLLHWRAPLTFNSPRATLESKASSQYQRK
jgi:hypothetical protein